MSGTLKPRVATVVFLAFLFVILLASCGSKHPTKPQSTADANVFTSSVTLGHTHTITINKSDIDNPPAGGINTVTSVSLGHTHTFMMSQSDLQNVQAGNTDVVTTGDTGGHAHDFTIQKWY